jgi:hypothetical protein
VKKIFILFFVAICVVGQAQTDSIPNEYHVSGNVGVTNNGISIIPTFSLQAPAFNATMSISKGGRFSIDPDLRLTFDGTKGGGMIWFRYQLVKDKRFQFRLGAHPAMNLALKSITENGKTWTITQYRRFLATEIAPSYTVSKHLQLGFYYLHGNGLQNDGPISTHFVNFSTALLDLPLGGNYAMNIVPQVYYLQVDKEDGFYSTGNLVLLNKKSPFSLMGTYNKEIRTNITGSRNLDWNVTLMYSFNNIYKMK